MDDLQWKFLLNLLKWMILGVPLWLRKPLYHPIPMGFLYHCEAPGCVDVTSSKAISIRSFSSMIFVDFGRSTRHVTRGQKHE